MTLNFYTLGAIYLVYSFLGWVAETVVATIRGGRFANRGAAAGPFCFIYGTTGVLLAVFMSNSGGAWDNAKKYIEQGNFGGKGSDAHATASCPSYS